MKKRLLGLVAMMLAAMIVVLAFPVQVKAEEFAYYNLKNGQKLAAGDRLYCYNSCGDVRVYVDNVQVFVNREMEGGNPYYVLSKNLQVKLNDGCDIYLQTPTVKTASYVKISPEQQAILKYNDAWDKVQKEYADETQLPVEPFMTAQAIASVPETVKNNSNAIANLTPLKTVPGVMALINKAQKVTAGDKVAIYTEKPMTFSKEGFEAISSQNKTVVYAFKIDGVLYQITIPAGAKVDFGDNTYVGPLWIGAQLGSTAILEQTNNY